MITKNKRNQLRNKMHRDLCTLYLNHVTQNVFGYHKYMYSSVTGMLMELGILSFSKPTLIHNYYSSFQNRLKASDILVKHIVAFQLWF